MYFVYRSALRVINFRESSCQLFFGISFDKMPKKGNIHPVNFFGRNFRTC